MKEKLKLNQHDSPATGEMNATEMKRSFPPVLVQLTASSEQGLEEEATDTFTEEVVQLKPGATDQPPPEDGDGDDSGGEHRASKVLLPPGLGEREALVMAVSRLLRLSSSEAEIAISTEGIGWESYSPNGFGTEDGMVVHYIKLPVRMLERNAHEGDWQDEEKTEDMPWLKQRVETFLPQFTEWLRYYEDGLDLPDTTLESLFDRWRVGRIGRLEEDWNDPAYEGKPNYNEESYNALRELITEEVRLEQARSHREHLAEEIPGQTKDLKFELLRLSDLLAISVPSEMAEAHAAGGYDVPGSMYQSWLSIRLALFLTESMMMEGEPGELLPEGVGGQLYSLSHHIAQIGKAKYGYMSKEAGTKTYGPWRDQEVEKMAILVDLGEERTGQQNQLLLLHFYRMSFALFELIGRNYSNSFEGKQDPEQEGEAIRHTARKGRELSDLLQSNQEVQKVHARFYPKEAADALRMYDPGAGADQGQELDLYLYYSGGNWVLKDFSNLDDTKENSIAAEPGAAVPTELFTNLNTRLRFPEGVLYYRIPSEGSYRIMKTDGDMGWQEWLRWAAMAGVVVGAALATGGASIPATLLMVGSGLGFAAAEVGDMVEKADHGMLGTQDMLLHGVNLVASLLASAGGVARLVLTPAAELATGGVIRAGEHVVTRYLAAGELAADTTALLVFTGTAYHDLTETAMNNPGQDGTVMRMASFYMAMGLLQVVGIKGGAADLRSGARLKMDVDTQGRPAVSMYDVEERMPGLTRHRERLLNRQDKLDGLREDIAAFDEQLLILRRNLGEATDAAQAQPLMAGTMIPVPQGMSPEAFRALSSIVKNRISRIGVQGQLTVQQVIAHLEKLGIEARYMASPSVRGIIRMLIDDVQMKGYTREEMDFIQYYRKEYPTSKKTNFELRIEFRNNYELGPNGYTRIKKADTDQVDFEARHLPEDQQTTSIEIPEGFDPSDAEAFPYLEELRVQRQHYRDQYQSIKRELDAKKENGQPITKADKDRLNKAKASIGRKSEQLAEATVDEMLQQQGFKRLYPDGPGSSRKGDLDRVFFRENGDGTFDVLEVKGGQSLLGSREIVNVPQLKGEGLRSRQGSGVYLVDVLLQMQKSGSRQAAIIADKLMQGLKRGKVNFSHFQQKFNQDGSFGKSNLNQFDISNASNYIPS